MYRDNLSRANSTVSESSAEANFQNFRRAHVAATQPKWPTQVLAKMTDLLSFQPGWDSYRALALRHDAAMFAMTVLQNVMTSGTPEPSVVPSATGGVQLEWHDAGIDLEIHVLAPYEGEVWWRDHATGAEHASDLGTDLSVLHEPISKLSA